MIVNRDPAALSLWIVDAAHGRAPLLPGDVSPWDTFYAEYRGANAALRASVDAVFRGLTASPDVAIRAAVVAHWFNVQGEPAFEAFSQLLHDHAELYAGQVGPESSHTLRAWLLDGLALKARGASALPAILAAPPEAGPLTSEVGTYVGALGLDATDALVRARPEPAMAECIKDAGYELHRNADVWSAALARSATWPAPLRAAMLAGGAAHYARFGGAPLQQEP